jgi:hypothetical protein
VYNESFERWARSWERFFISTAALAVFTPPDDLLPAAIVLLAQIV